MRTLIAAVTFECILLGLLTWEFQREERFIKQYRKAYDNATATLERAFESAPDGFKSCAVPWAERIARDFDNAEIEFWLTQMQVKPRLAGLHRGNFYKAASVNGEITLENMTIVFENHFTRSFYPLGFESAAEPRIEMLSYGKRYLVTLVDRDTDIAIDLTFVFSPDGFVCVTGDVGRN